jgi:ATP-dependent Lhr-like helicase
VVFRDIAMRETLAPAWRDVLVVLLRMETRGEIRGGRFAAAFVGEQFALPEALDLLRAVKRAGEVDVAWDALPLWLAAQRSALARTAS